MADKLIITYEEYKKVVEKLALEIEKKYKPTVLVGIMRGAPLMIPTNTVGLYFFSISKASFSTTFLYSS